MVIVERTHASDSKGRRRLSAVGVVLLSIVLAGCQRPFETAHDTSTTKPAEISDRFERDIDNLTAANPLEKSRASLDALEAAGIDAFPALVAHLNDHRKAQPSFFGRDAVDVLPSGESRVHEPTMGEACFDIIQGQVEGNWPKDFRDYYALTPENVHDWLVAHRGLTLAQLREAAKQESLRRVRTDLQTHPTSDRLRSIDRFLRKPFEER